MKAVFINKTGENVANLMRRAQYHYLGANSETGQMNFVHPLGKNPYPRFHAYLRENPATNEVFFNLHLDQKKPVYPVRKPLSSSGSGDNTEENRYFEKKLESFKLSHGACKGVPHAHNADYEGEVLEKEAERMKGFFYEN